MAQAKLRDELLAPAVVAPTMLSMHDIMELTRSSRSTIDRAIAQGTFPKPAVRLSQRMPRWFTADYNAWAEEQRRKQRTEEPRVKARRA